MKPPVYHCPGTKEEWQAMRESVADMIEKLTKEQLSEALRHALQPRLNGKVIDFSTANEGSNWAYQMWVEQEQPKEPWIPVYYDGPKEEPPE